MNVISAVANLVKERDYYKEQYEDCKAVIKQLVDGPGEIEYIHPLDVHDFIKGMDIIDLWLDPMKVKDSEVIEIARTGKKYKQSVNIPAKTRGPFKSSIK